MYHFIRSVRLYKSYSYQVTFFERFFFCLSGAFALTEFIRSFLVGINIYQFNQGLYICLIFAGFTLLIITTTLLFLIPIQNNAEYRRGSKDFLILAQKLDQKIGFFFFQFAIYFAFFIVIPISLEAIVQYNNTTFVGELWAYEELQKALTILLYILIFVLQIPVVAIPNIDEEKSINYLVNNLKNVNFFVCIAAGMITPTVDIPTQINFFLIGIFLYLYTYFMVSKEISIETEVLI